MNMKRRGIIDDLFNEIVEYVRKECEEHHLNFDENDSWVDAGETIVLQFYFKLLYDDPDTSIDWLIDAVEFGRSVPRKFNLTFGDYNDVHINTHGKYVRISLYLCELR